MGCARTDKTVDTVKQKVPVLEVEYPSDERVVLSELSRIPAEPGESMNEELVRLPRLLRAGISGVE